LTFSQPEADLTFAQHAFRKIANSKQRADIDAVLSSLLLVEKYLLVNPSNTTALHLKALLCERLNKHEAGAEAIATCLASLETAYEEYEDFTVERQFVIAQLTGGRLHLANKSYENAAEAFQTALSLLTPETDSEEERPDETTRRLRTFSRWGLGMTQYHLEQPDDAVASFTEACSEAADMPELTGHADVLLARLLWAIGDAEGAQEKLLERLVECINICGLFLNKYRCSVSAEPEHLQAIATLAAIGLLASDDSLIDAALSEIQELNTDVRTSLDPRGEVLRLLAQHHIREVSPPQYRTT
jgi:superkiller protein 3